MKTDRKYEAARNRLIPEAVKVANYKYGLHPRMEAADKWNKKFHAEMERLVKERGMK
jgi:hypothetical protein